MFEIRVRGDVWKAGELLYAAMALMNGYEVRLPLDVAGRDSPVEGVSTVKVYLPSGKEPTRFNVAFPDNVLLKEHSVFRVVIRHRGGKRPRGRKRSWGWSDEFEVRFTRGGEGVIRMTVKRVKGIAGRVRSTFIVDALLEHVFRIQNSLCPEKYSDVVLDSVASAHAPI